ncbi:MAG: hypothetical protein Q4B42_05795 [Oscillospiraceae bacterium]|nr:hypothetical protein [Oscillospiraceae bacterium]
MLTSLLNLIAAAIYCFAERLTAKGVLRGMDEPERSPAGELAVCVLVTGAGAAILLFGGEVPLASAVCIMLSVTLRCALLRWDFKAAAFAALHMAFYFLCAQSLVTGLLSLAFGKNMYQILTASGYYRWVMPLVTLLVLLATLASYFSKSRKRPGWLDLERERWIKNLLVKLLLYLFCLYGSFNLYFNFDIVWFSIQQAVNALISAGVYALLDFYDQRFMERQEEELQMVNSQKAFTARNAVYQAHRRALERNMEIRRVLREMDTTVGYLLQESRIEEARENLGQYCVDMNALVGDERPMSDSDIIGAMLYEYANICERGGIGFEAQVPTPKGISLCERDFSIFLAELLDGLTLPLLPGISKGAVLRLMCSSQNGWMTVRCEAEVPEGFDRGAFRNHYIARAQKAVEKAGGLFTMERGKGLAITVHLPPAKVKQGKTASAKRKPDKNKKRRRSLKNG